MKTSLHISIVLLFCFVIINVNAQNIVFDRNIMLDTTFSNDGKVQTNINARYYNNGSTVSSVLLQTDGKIVVVGNSARYNDFDFFIMRYLPSGIVDTAFGDGGIIHHGNKDVRDYIYQAKFTSDGKIIAVAFTQGNYCLVKFLSNGKRDVGFGQKGYVQLAQQAYSIDVDTGDRIVVSEKYYNYDEKKLILALQRFYKNGEPDLGFGENNFTSITVSPDYLSKYYITEPSRVKLYNDKIVVASCWASTYNSRQLAVVQFKNNGTADSTFNKSGILTVNNIDGFFNLGSVTIQSGNIIIGGTISNSDGKFFLTRVTAKGKVDKNFGANGFVITRFPYTTQTPKIDVLSALCIQDDKKIVAVGSSIGEYDSYGLFALCRYNINGSIDNTFGKAGFVKTLFGYTKDSRTQDAIIQPDGKIIAAGYHDTISGNGGIGGQIAIARYTKEKVIAAQSAVIDNYTGINESSFYIFPNPVKNNLHIAGLDANKKYTLRITDEVGKSILLTQINYSNFYNFNMQKLKGGNYYANIISDNKILKISFIKQ